jgi:hypothetical protein
MDQNAKDATNLTAPEDPEVLAICERIGFGAVISSASRQWCRRDPVGGFIYTAWGLVTSALGSRRLEKDRHPWTCECAPCWQRSNVTGASD